MFVAGPVSFKTDNPTGAYLEIKPGIHPGSQAGSLECIGSGRIRRPRENDQAERSAAKTKRSTAGIHAGRGPIVGRPFATDLTADVETRINSADNLGNHGILGDGDFLIVEPTGRPLLVTMRLALRFLLYDERLRDSAPCTDAAAVCSAYPCRRRSRLPRAWRVCRRAQTSRSQSGLKPRLVVIRRVAGEDGGQGAGARTGTWNVSPLSSFTRAPTSRGASAAAKPKK